ncbi:MAG: carboxypeptidase-like regulatory domain-containing protein, partial [Myxococcota bacterium]
VVMPGYGPVPPAGKPVTLGPFKKKIQFVSLASNGHKDQQVLIELRGESPRIRITVLERKSSGKEVPFPDARCEVIGVNLGKSDSAGKFVTRPVVDGAYNVHVSAPGYFPQNQPGDAFYRGVEVTPGGINFATGKRDVELTVVLGASAPSNLPINVPDPIRIWASGTSTPHAVRPDPFLSSDTAQGQGGWDVGIQFSSFADLAAELHGTRPDGTPILDHQVSRLAFVAHGAPDIVDVDQKHTSQTLGATPPPATTSLTLARFGVYSTEIKSIGRALRYDSVVYVASCRAGQGPGEELLKALSKAWPTTTVVGLRTLAAVPVGNIGSGTILMYAGVRDTRYEIGATTKGGAKRDYEDPAIAGDLKKLPWMSETSPHATLARDGNIIRRGAGATGAK